MPQDIFTDAAFESFEIPVLDDQMPVVRREIQPVFRYYGRILENHIDQSFKSELPVYVAKHIQRKVKPLRHTWVAIGGDNRGYKKYPHFEIGINQNFIYIMLCYQFHLLEKEKMAQFLKKESLLKLPSDMHIMLSHYGPDYFNLNEENLNKGLDRLEKIKGADFQIGRAMVKSDDRLTNPEALEEWLKQTVDELWPLFEESMVVFNLLTNLN